MLPGQNLSQSQSLDQAICRDPDIQVLPQESMAPNRMAGAMRKSQAATAMLLSTGTSEIVFRICEAIW